jgi:hypothetical protein
MITGKEKPAENPRNSMVSVVYHPGFTQKTANSTGSAAVFIRISGFGSNPVKYTDPDGRSDDEPKGLIETWDVFIKNSNKTRSSIIETILGNLKINKSSNGVSIDYNRKTPLGEFKLHFGGKIAVLSESDRKEIAQHSYDGGHGPGVNLDDPSVAGIQLKIDEVLTSPSTIFGVSTDKKTGNDTFGFLAGDGTLVIYNPSAEDKGTAFYDPNGKYFEDHFETGF